MGVFKDTVFRLTGDIAPQYLGKTFDDLDEVDQRRLRNQVLKATILVYSNNQPDIKFSVFQRINTGSVTLTQQEIRNCIYGGSLNDFLHELNKESAWRSYISPKPDSRMRDEETLLRFFAGYYKYDKYQKPMTRFLNHFMEEHREDGDAEINKWKDLLLSTLEVVRLNSEGFNPFSSSNSKKQMNRAIFESVMVSIARLKHEGKDDFSDFESKYRILMSNKDYIDSVTAHTSDDIRYATRFRLAYENLK